MPIWILTYYYLLIKIMLVIFIMLILFSIYNEQYFLTL